MSAHLDNRAALERLIDVFLARADELGWIAADGSTKPASRAIAFEFFSGAYACQNVVGANVINDGLIFVLSCTDPVNQARMLKHELRGARCAVERRAAA